MTTRVLRLPLPATSQRDGFLLRYRGGELALPQHAHDELEMNFVVSGRATYLFGDRRVELRPRTLLWIQPRQPHFLVEESADFAMWVLSLRPLALRRCSSSEATRRLREGSAGDLHARRLADRPARRLDGLLSIIHQHSDDAAFNAGLGFAITHAWLDYQAVDRETMAVVIHPAVERAARILSEPTCTDSAEDIAARCGISSSRLRQLFRRELGTHITEFRNRRRVERFVVLFAQRGDGNVTAAALDAGFGSYPQFHRIFKQVMGYGPAEHRRRYYIR